MCPLTLALQRSAQTDPCFSDSPSLCRIRATKIQWLVLCSNFGFYSIPVIENAMEFLYQIALMPIKEKSKLLALYECVYLNPGEKNPSLLSDTK